jgi:hypothetical protein
MACALPLPPGVSHGAAGESGNGARSARSVEADALLADLKGSTDLASLVERVARKNLPKVVVPAATLDAWAARDPVGWEKVSSWLAANGITVVRI